MGVGELAALCGALGWAISGVIIKSATIRVRAVRINAVYIFIAASMGLIAAVVSGRFDEIFQISSRDTALLIGAALIGSTGDVAILRSITIGDLGRNFTTATAIFVVATALGGWLILDESVSGFAWGGGLFILIGVYMTNVTAGSRVSRPVFSGWGDLLSAPALAVSAGLLWAISLLMYDEGLLANNVFAANGLSHLGPLVIYGLVVMLWAPARPLPIRRGDGLRVLISGLFFGASIISFIVAVDRSQASSTAILISSSPLFVVPLSIAFLGEKLTRRSAQGVAVTLVGVFLVVGLG
ncbi:MAG: DMT family transporter [Chloroflexi bacterium]|nr:DMT family transporter [Chloroflexota bacterium]